MYSKNSLITIILVLLTTGILLAQNFKGEAIYQMSRSISLSFGDSSKIDRNEMKSLQKKLSQGLNGEYKLTFDANSSSWQEIASLGSGPTSASSGGTSIVIAKGSGQQVLYKNLSTNMYQASKDLFGKAYIVEDELKPYDWKLTGQTKKVGDYNCQQALYEKIVESKRFSTGMEEMEVSQDTIRTEVWFTPEIPVSHGPKKYYGLPGLILEVRTGKTVIICSKITLNPKDGVEIPRPKKGKRISAEEYKQISKENIDKMMKKYDGESESSMSIRIGG